MKNQIKKDLTDIKNRYATQRKTEIINAEEVEIIKEEIAEEVIYVVVDKFGYTKALDEATYERNIESISQYKYCIKMKNTDKLCIFTDANKCHYIKGLQIPIGKFKDKGTMLNLISNYNSNETILLMQPLSDIITTPLIFVNEDGMVKIVNGNEFDVSKRMIDSTKKDSGKLIGVFPLKTEKDIVLQTQNNFFVRFKIEEISEMKRTSIGVRGIKLSPEDKVIAANIGSSKTEISEILFSSIKLTKRDVIGTQKLKKN
jgi:DNA gyrase subunit A